jgi:nitrite reductase/ring-hydroxylating ferredoxin subunit/uncharacterized membrane protein
MIADFLERIIDAQAGWATPFGDWLHGLVGAIFNRMVPVRDFLNGTWIGHPLHALLTDAPIGMVTLAIIFEILGLEVASDVSLLIGVLAMLAAALAGYADFADTDGRRRVRATVHSTLMVISLILFVIALLLRYADAGRALPLLLVVIGFVILAFAAHVGGLVVYALGNMVDRHAFRSTGTKWGPLEVSGELVENTPVKANFGVQALVLVRQGERIYALHNECAHAGGPLSGGTLVDGCIQCPWHGSRFRLSDGQARRGPTAYDQPTYEVRATEAGGWEARRAS